MSHYTRHYMGPREERDEHAIEDIREYLGDEGFMSAVEAVTTSEVDKSDVAGLNRAFALAGVRGYPFHAFCRRYCLAAYREWMHDGHDAVMTDEQGFAL